MTLGEKLKSLRKSKKYSLRQLSEITGISHTYISDIEKGNLTGRDDTIEKLINSLSESFDEKKELQRIRDWENTPESIKKEFSYLRYNTKDINYLELGHPKKKNDLYLLIPVYESFSYESGVIVGEKFLKHHPYLVEEHNLFLEDNEYKDEEEHEYVGIIQNDTSMSDKISEGSIVSVNRVLKPKHNEVGIFYVDGSVLVRKIVNYKEISILKPFNGEYEDIIVNHVKNFKVIGKVVSSTTLY